MNRDKFIERRKKRFWSKVDKDNHGECWIWLGYLDKDGYGVFWDQEINQQRRAHRMALIITNPEINLNDPNKLVIHKCDNPSCVNPEHLRISNTQGNIDDKMSKNRWKGAPQKLLTVGNETKTVKEWASISKISRTTLCRRISLGWKPEDVIGKPLKKRKCGQLIKNC